eukprot:TRINITY_DN10929_c0_g1_i1.p1 TRINITY_DN10929_c0_g1~~TRINITY_DN10929_c0_g1_i1.p1  ORF type:complete len:310 (-),score=53.73 TRINITY_DN10929_c0_g1_i1:17-946(-)
MTTIKIREDLEESLISFSAIGATSILREIVQSVEAHKIRNLDLYGQQIADSHVELLSSCKHLTSLNLGSCDVGNWGVKLLCMNESIRILNLSMNTRISDDGIRELAKNRNLTSLNISYIKSIGDSLVELIKNTSLVQLGLIHTTITEKAFSALQENRTLLVLSWNVMNDPEAQLVQDRLKENQKEHYQKMQNIRKTTRVLISDRLNRNSHSLWNQLPKEIVTHVFSLMTCDSTKKFCKDAFKDPQKFLEEDAKRLQSDGNIFQIKIGNDVRRLYTGRQYEQQRVVDEPSTQNNQLVVLKNKNGVLCNLL